MPDIQRYKITNTSDGSSVFFTDRVFKSASSCALEYIARNKGNFSMKLYFINYSAYGTRYLLIETIPQVI